MTLQFPSYRWLLVLSAFVFVPEALTFSPDGKISATGGGGGDSSGRLWKITSE